MKKLKDIIKKWENEILKYNELIKLYYETKRYSHMEHYNSKKEVALLILNDLKELLK